MEDSSNSPPEDGPDLTKWDARDAERTVVLLGAGASADAGLPTSRQLHAELAKRLPPLYSNISKLLFTEEPVDVERLFRVLQFMHQIELDARTVQPLLPTSERPEELDIARLVREWLPEIEEHLVTQRGAVGASPIGRLIDDLWIELCELLWIDTPIHRNLGYLTYLLRSMAGGTVVTLNYDNSLERANQIGVAVRVDRGTHPSNPKSPLSSGEPSPVRVIKLHGSLGWTYAYDDGHVETLLEDNLPSRVSMWKAKLSPVEPPAVIFGAGNKLRADGPFLDMFMEFKQTLSKAERLIVVGYSGADAHVNTVIRDWIGSRSGSRLVRFNVFGDESSEEIGIHEEAELARSFAEELSAAAPFAQIQVVYGPAARVIDRIMAADSGLLR